MVSSDDIQIMLLRVAVVMEENPKNIPQNNYNGQYVIAAFKNRIFSASYKNNTAVPNLKHTFLFLPSRI